MSRLILVVSVAALTIGGVPRVANAQNPAAPMPAQRPIPAPPVPDMERVSFDQAVRRVIDKNPSIAEAATNILRAEALLQQARAATRPTVDGSITNVLINSQRGFEGIVAQPQNQAFFGVSLAVPVLAASQWAATAQARDQVDVAKLSTTDFRRQIAVAGAEAYLSIISARRQVDVSTQARDDAYAHLDYAERRLAAGAGSRLNWLRAGQQASADEARLEAFRYALRRAQEALGVLMGENGPIDATGEPSFTVPDTVTGEGWMSARTDVQLFTASAKAADRVVHDSSKDWYPTARASFSPQYVAPAGSFSPSGSWSFAFTLSQPIFDSGARRGLLRLRESAAEASRLALTSVQIQARSDVRLAQESVKSADRTLASLRLSSDQAAEAARITATAFEAGANTNIEVIDAQRTSRDAFTAAALAEDALLRAKLDLLTALGEFPPNP